MKKCQLFLGNVEFGIMAQKAGAWLFVLEHRFYGESYATS